MESFVKKTELFHLIDYKLSGSGIAIERPVPLSTCHHYWDGETAPLPGRATEDQSVVNVAQFRFGVITSAFAIEPLTFFVPSMFWETAIAPLGPTSVRWFVIRVFFHRHSSAP